MKYKFNVQFKKNITCADYLNIQSGSGPYTTLSFADVSVVARASCKSQTGDLINDRVVCAAATNRGICRGDLGTPLALRGTRYIIN